MTKTKGDIFQGNDRHKPIISIHIGVDEQVFYISSGNMMDARVIEYG